VSRSSRRSPLPPPLTAQRWRDQVEELLRQDRINADSEWSLYQHLLRWMSHHSDPSESLLAPADETGPVRGGHLLAHVRWPLLGKEVLWKQVWHHQSLGNMWHHAEPYVAEATMLLNASEEMCVPRPARPHAAPRAALTGPSAHANCAACATLTHRGCVAAGWSRRSKTTSACSSRGGTSRRASAPTHPSTTSGSRRGPRACPQQAAPKCTESARGTCRCFPSSQAGKSEPDSARLRGVAGDDGTVEASLEQREGVLRVAVRAVGSSPQLPRIFLAPHMLNEDRWIFAQSSSSSESAVRPPLRRGGGGAGADFGSLAFSHSSIHSQKMSIGSESAVIDVSYLTCRHTHHRSVCSATTAVERGLAERGLASRWVWWAGRAGGRTAQIVHLHPPILAFLFLRVRTSEKAQRKLGWCTSPCCKTG
jgi:hypothetical protein